MKKLTFITILIISWTGLFAQGTFNTENTGNSTYNKSYHPSNFEDYVANWDALSHVPGLSLCVLRNGELYWVHHYGLANINQNKPVDDSSCFYSASIAKTVVQTASMQLWEQGDFELHDDASEVLDFNVINPYCPDSSITYYQLMIHTSSVKDNWDMIDLANNNGASLAQFMTGYFMEGGDYYSTGNFYNYCPGTQWNYSNVGNSFLGYLTEVMVANQVFDEYVRQNVFQPIGINNASYFIENINADHLVTQYIISGGTPYAVTTPNSHGGIYPAAALKISAIELAKFLGMYMQQGTFNDSTILNPETIELITTPTSWNGSLGTKQCLTWFYMPYQDFTFHTGGTSFASTMLGYDKDDQWGCIMLMNAKPTDPLLFEFYYNLMYFGCLYEPITMASIVVNDTDGDKIIEANEEFELGLTISNQINHPVSLENVMATLSVSSAHINLISDSVVSIGTLNYLDEIQLPADQFVFSVNENLEPGNVEFQIQFTWDEGVGYTSTFNLFCGHADVLLVRDEVSVFVDPALQTTQDMYLKSLDTLGFLTNYWDIEVMGDPTSEFIQTFPAVIWFTGSDEENTLSENNQTILEGYLDNGGQLFLSGEDISDELAGTSFLENYLFTEHIQDTWFGAETVKGIENDPIGNGQTYQINIGDAIANQTSLSVVEPLAGAFKSFGYYPPLDGAAVRYENDTYKTIFFAFGFEAINGFNNRTDILDRILNNYFIIPHPCLPEGITFTTQEEIDNFETNNPGCIEIEGDVTINGDDIDDLSGLEILIAIGGDLNISSNVILNNLSGLDSIANIGGNLVIIGNPVLSGLNGLDKITSIGGNLEIIGNEVITSLSGLENIESESIVDLSIWGNSTLSDCDIWNICYYINNTGDSIEIHDNTGECETLEDVVEACITDIVEQSVTEDLNIYPNPISSNVIISYNLKQSSHVTLKILDLSGKEMLTLVNELQKQGEQKVNYNSHGLKPGVYFCVLKTTEGIQTKKIIKLD